MMDFSTDAASVRMKTASKQSFFMDAPTELHEAYENNLMNTSTACEGSETGSYLYSDT